MSDKDRASSDWGSAPPSPSTSPSASPTSIDFRRADFSTFQDDPQLQKSLLKLRLPVERLAGRTLKEFYYIEKKIGGGGMALVYKAMHTAFQAPVAIKFLHADVLEQPQIYEQFLDEARLQFTLRHPHIVHVTDYIDEKGVVGCVMDWVDGMDLETWLTQHPGPLSAFDLWRLLGPVLDAMGYAHLKKIVHRDLKPANILLHLEGEKILPKISDFGIAKVLDSGRISMENFDFPIGSLPYIAPEQIGRNRQVDHRADIYSLGVLLFRMATGERPFTGSAPELIFQHLHKQPPLPSSLVSGFSKPLEEIILRCLDKSPERRFQSCQALHSALSHALSIPLDPGSVYDQLPTSSASQTALPALAATPSSETQLPAQIDASTSQSAPFSGPDNEASFDDETIKAMPFALIEDTLPTQETNTTPVIPPKVRDTTPSAQFAMASEPGPAPNEAFRIALVLFGCMVVGAALYLLLGWLRML